MFAPYRVALASPTTSLPRWRRGVTWTGLLALGPAAAGSLFGWLQAWHWRCEQFCHFRLQYLALSLLSLGLFVVARRWGWSACAAAVALGNALAVAPLYLAPSGPSLAREPPTLKLLAVNVLTSNTRHESLLQLMAAEQPDVVVLMEVNERWRRAVAQALPYSHFATREDNFGMAILSRLPLAEAMTLYPGDKQVPAIRCRFEHAGQSWTLYGLHPLPPVSGEYARSRDQYLHEMAELAGRAPARSLLMGDFNTTSWSRVFDQVLHQSSLVDSRRGFGVQPTWSPGLALLAIPIDHCLVPARSRVTQRRVGVDIGSDHRPLILSIQSEAILYPEPEQAEDGA